METIPICNFILHFSEFIFSVCTYTYFMHETTTYVMVNSINLFLAHDIFSCIVSY